MGKLGLLLLSVALGATGQVLFKYGAVALKTTNTEGILRFINLPIFSGLVLYGISTVIWVYALRTVELSIAYPFNSLGIVLVFIASYFVFQESINAARIIGLALIVSGILVVSQS